MVKLALAEGKDALPKSRVVEFLWDGDVLAGELDPEQGPRFFVHEPGTFLPMLQQEHGEVFTYVNDHLGMPKELVDEDGRVAWSAAHSAWGRVVETWRDPQAKRAVETPFRLLGQYLDEDTGLCYTRFRYFDPEMGRWLSPDPLGIAGGRNLFAFDGAPTVEVDPWGLCAEGSESPGLSDVPRAGSALKADPHHAFPDVVDNFARDDLVPDPYPMSGWATIRTSDPLYQAEAA